VKHEHTRPDRDNYLTYLAENDNSNGQFDKMPTYLWEKTPAEFGGEFELLSVMTYASGVGGKVRNGIRYPVTIVKSTGKWHGEGKRISTMDALQVFYKYCRIKNTPPKPYGSCKTGDPTGITRLVYNDRICDGVQDWGPYF